MRTSGLITIGAIVLAFSNSCNNNNNKKLEYVEPVFEKVISTNIEVLNNSFLFNPGNIGVVDTLIIYSGRTNVSDKAFHLFSKNTGDYLASFGNIGRAHGEKSQVGGGFSIDRDRKIVYVYDNSQGKVISYSLDKVLVGETDYAKDMNLPGIVNNITSNHFFYLKNSFLAGYSRAGRFLVCTEEDSITISDFYPSLDEPEQYKKVEHRYYLFLGCMAVKPDGNMFVHATRTGCIFEIWKYRGKNLSPYVIKGFFRPNYLSSDRDKDYPNVLPNEKDAYGISVLSCTNKYIYAEYNNIPGFSSNKIAVFDWEGEPQKLYSVNKEIYTFYVDDDTTAYGLAMNDNNDIELITIPLK